MALFYKQFLSPRTAFWLVFSVFCLALALSTSPAQADNNVFTVSGVKVDVTAKDALKARDKAFEKAQTEAFKVLATRVLPESEAKSMKTPVLAVISNLIKDYEVTNEQLSAVRYVGTYTFRFSESEVKRYFTGHGSSYTDVGSRPVLAIPFLQTANDGALLWSPYNIWLAAWNRASNLTGLVPVVVPLGDLEDVRNISDGEALHYERRNLYSMLGRYDAKEAVIIIAEPDYDLAAAKTDEDTASGRLRVQIYRTDRSTPELVQQSDILTRGAETRASFYDRAVREVFASLQKDWKKKTIVHSQVMNKLSVRVHIASLQQWAETQRVLKSVNGIERVALQSLSPKFARVDLFYQGSIDRLRLALEQANMSLETPGANARAQQDQSNPLNRYSLDRFLSGGYNAADEGVYDLYLNKYRKPASLRQQQQRTPAAQYEYSYQSRPQNRQQTGYTAPPTAPYRPAVQPKKTDTFEARF